MTRTLRLLDVAPDSATVTAFVARCRQPDGTYSPSPESGYQPADAHHHGLVGTYFAFTIDRWINEPDASGIN